MWQYIIGGATVFALIVGLFSVYNGRATRKYIGELIKETRESTQNLIKETRESTQNLIKEEMNRIQEILVLMNKTLEENNKILKQK